MYFRAVVLSCLCDERVCALHNLIALFAFRVLEFGVVMSHHYVGTLLCLQTFHQYEVVGRAKPTKKVPHPKVYRMKLFATNRVTAGSRFWYFLSLLKKVKRQVGEIMEIHEVCVQFDRSVLSPHRCLLRCRSRDATALALPVHAQSKRVYLTPIMLFL